MSADDWPRLLLLALALILPLSALRRRQIAGSRLMMMILVWVGLFLAAAVVFSWIRG